MNWAVNNELLEKNPTVGLKVFNKKAEKAKNKRMPFTIEQLNNIFQAPLYTGCLNDRNGYAKAGTNIIKRGRYWIPLISLFSGARLNEICQLYVSDIQTINDVIVFNINDEGDKTLKASASNRIIPVHPLLIEIGLMEYVDSMKEKGEQRLFPELKKNTMGAYSDIFSKWFGRFLKSCNAKTEKTSFHSFRHTFRDAMREADISRECVLSIGGWEGNSGTDAIYGSGISTKKLNEAIYKIKYEGLNIEHLKTDK